MPIRTGTVGFIFTFPFSRQKYAATSISIPPRTCLRVWLSMCATILTAKKETAMNVSRMPASFRKGRNLNMRIPVPNPSKDPGREGDSMVTSFT